MKKYSFKEFCFIVFELIVSFLLISKGSLIFLNALEKLSLQKGFFKSLFMIDKIEGFISMFLANIYSDIPIYENVFIIIKALILMVFLLRIVYILFYYNTGENTIAIFFLKMGKLLLVLLFVLCGAANILANLKPRFYLHFGNMFELVPMEKFLETKTLFMLVIYGLAAFDIVSYHNKR